MSRLIDADLLEEILDVNIQKLQDEIDDARTEVQKLVYEAQEFSTMEMIKLIKEQPTAYNVDKVVEQLEDEKMWYETHGVNMDMKKGIIGATCKAIEIIKAGGIDE